jgi:hypothetical protein
MTASRDLGWWYWFLTVGVLGAGLLGWIVGPYLAMQPCGEVFQQSWLERVHG